MNQQESKEQQVFIQNKKYLEAKSRYSLNITSQSDQIEVESIDKESNSDAGSNTKESEKKSKLDKSKYSLSKHINKSFEIKINSNSPSPKADKKLVIEAINNNEIPKEDINLLKPKKPFFKKYWKSITVFSVL